MPTGGGGGGSTTSTVTNKADPWAGIQPYLQQAAGDISNLYGSGQLKYDYYPNSTIAPQSGETQLAQGLTVNRALSGSPVMSQAKQYTQGLLSGDYLDSNPYADAMFDKAADKVQSRVNSAFQMGGRSGSGINQQVLTREMGDTAKNIYGGLYEAERGRQQQGLLFAPQLAAQDYTDLSALSSIGADRDQRSQALLNEDINRFNFQQQAPTNAVQNFIGLLNQTGGQYGQSQGTTSQPYYGGNSAANTLGLLGATGLGSGLFGAGVAGATGLPWLSGAGLGSQLGGLGMLLSDSRLKHDITLVDNVDGINVYSFRYMPFIDPEQKLCTGVMAQEIMKSHPEAVHVVDGFLAVNYDMLPVAFRRVH